MIKFGRHSYADKTCWIKYFTVDQEVSVGDFCSIASGTKFFWPQIHHPEWVTTSIVERFRSYYSPLPDIHGKQKKGITLGHDVWIGDGVALMPGITIGNGCVVGAGSIVTHDLEPYGVYAGVPARLIRYRFGEMVIGELQQLEWWQLNDQAIVDLVPILFSDNISGFIKRASQYGSEFRIKPTQAHVGD